MSKRNLIISVVVGIIIILGIIFLPNLLFNEDKIVENVQDEIDKKFELIASPFPFTEILKTKDSVIQYKIQNTYGNGAGKMCIELKEQLLCEGTSEFEHTNIKFERPENEKDTVYAVIPYYNVYYSLNKEFPIYFAYIYNNKFYKSKPVGEDLTFKSLVKIEFKDNKDYFKEEIGSDTVSIKISDNIVKNIAYKYSDNYTLNLGYTSPIENIEYPNLRSAVLVGTNAGDFFVIERSNGVYTDSVEESTLPVEFNVKRIGQEARGSSKVDIELDNFDRMTYEIKNKLSDFVSIERVEDEISYYSPYIVSNIVGKIPDGYFLSCVSEMFDSNVEKTCDDIIIGKEHNNKRLIGVENKKSGGFYVGVVKDPYIVEKHDVLLFKEEIGLKTIMVIDDKDKEVHNNFILMKLSEGKRYFRVMRESKSELLSTYTINENNDLVKGSFIENKIYQIISNESKVFNIENNSCLDKDKYVGCVIGINPLSQGEGTFTIYGANNNKEVYRVVIR